MRDPLGVAVIDRDKFPNGSTSPELTALGSCESIRDGPLIIEALMKV